MKLPSSTKAAAAVSCGLACGALPVSQFSLYEGSGHSNNSAQQFASRMRMQDVPEDRAAVGTVEEIKKSPSFDASNSFHWQSEELHPAWRHCTAAIQDLQWTVDSEDDSQPNHVALSHALLWMALRQVKTPSQPPTCITFEPAGGLIIERRETVQNGKEKHEVWTFYNDGTSEKTVFWDGLLTELTDTSDCNLKPSYI